MDILNEALTELQVIAVNTSGYQHYVVWALFAVMAVWAGVEILRRINIPVGRQANRIVNTPVHVEDQDVPAPELK